jgi:hypothetical protein
LSICVGERFCRLAGEKNTKNDFQNQANEKSTKASAHTETSVFGFLAFESVDGEVNFSPSCFL